MTSPETYYNLVVKIWDSEDHMDYAQTWDINMKSYAEVYATTKWAMQQHGFHIWNMVIVEYEVTVPGKPDELVAKTKLEEWLNKHRPKPFKH